METRRLQILLELSRRGSMRAVAERLQISTSSVSQQIASLGRDVGAPLVQPDGRRVRLTPAGRRLADHATEILAAVEAARADLDPEAEPAGTVRVAGFATALRRALLPIVADLARSHPDVQVLISEHETAEALGLLATDEADLALTYDYTLAPARLDSAFERYALWSTPWRLGVPAATAGAAAGDAVALFRLFRERDWIGNSRNPADEHVVRTIASMAGFEPRITHQSDSLDLVEEMIVAGMGVALLPTDRPTRDGVALLPLVRPEVELRAYAVIRRGRAAWAPLALLLDRLAGEQEPPDPPTSAVGASTRLRGPR